MGSGNQFVGIGAPSLRLVRRKGLAFRKGTILCPYNAFSALETANPNGRGGLFHEGRFPNEMGLGTLRNKWPASMSEPREPRTQVDSRHRSAVSRVFIL
jgi:hypothetical protein